MLDEKLIIIIKKNIKIYSEEWKKKSMKDWVGILCLTGIPCAKNMPPLDRASASSLSAKTALQSKIANKIIPASYGINCSSRNI